MDDLSTAAVGYKPGCRDDFDRLYRDSYQRVFRTLMAVLGDRNAAEDCAQDTFVQAFRAWPRWQPLAPAEAWLHRIALNAARSRRRYDALRSLGTLVRRLPQGVERSEARLANAEFLMALRRLPTAQAGIIVLRYYHGYSNREIAAALGAPESTIASRLAVARQRLRRELEGDEVPPIPAFEVPDR